MWNFFHVRKGIAVVGVIGAGKGYGGFETLTENLLGDESPITTVYCSSAYYENKPKTYKNAKMVYLPLRSKGISKIAHTTISMLHAAFSGHQYILVLGVSGGFGAFLLRVLNLKVQIVTNIDGLEWKREKWTPFIRKILKGLEVLSCRFSQIVISDHIEIERYIKEEYGIESVNIAYGGDHALRTNCPPTEVFTAGFALAICRIVPENNIQMVLQAFAKHGCPLLFIGNWNDSRYGRELKLKYQYYESLELLDPIFDLDRLASYREHCNVYVHGHSIGGTNPSLVEVMHFGKPILAYDCAYNRGTMENFGCYFSCSDSLQELLANGSYADTDHGRSLKTIADERYTWAVIREKYFQLFG